MQPYQKQILSLTRASAITGEEPLQTLWSGYGKILRITLEGAKWPTVIAKLVTPPIAKNHPRGWNTDIGHQRKIRSYQVEENWYRDHLVLQEACRMARFIGAKSDADSQLLVMEDLDAAGYNLRKQSINLTEIKACLSWLAHFHALYLGKNPVGLWEEGTYWHLDTRPEELKIMRDSELKKKAGEIDRALKNCKYRTIVHGDAKLANFCFSKDGRVAAVDFQYVGGGCGVKDFAYFLSSCLDEDGCEKYEKELLGYYFEVLLSSVSLEARQKDELEAEWRRMYPIAWADFTRFLEGWAPSHRKLHRYSRGMMKKALKVLK